MSVINLLQNNENATKAIYKNSSDSSDLLPVSNSEDYILFQSSKNTNKLKHEENFNQDSADICAMYLPLSSSSVFRHPYYKYPGIIDPGIKDALLQAESRIIYADNGQELYLALCKEMGLCPIRSFYKELLEEKVNLRYYGISPMGFRPIAIAIKNNNFVVSIDLTDNWISEDGCFHLGVMLIENITLEDLNLHGCRIGPEGARQLFANLHMNHALRKINLTKNYLGDVGVEYLAKAIFYGSGMTNINLCYNNLTAKAVAALTEAFETHNKLTHLDLSWNSINSPNAVYNLCNKLSENVVLEELNLSWMSLSGLRVGKGIKSILTNQTIRYLNLSNNKLSSVALKQIAIGLESNKSLRILDLSYNPLTPNDAILLLLCLKDRKLKLHTLLLENVFVTIEFLELREEILSLKYRKNAVVTWGGLIQKFTPIGADMRDIVLNRADVVCINSKKPVDIALVILELKKINKEPIEFKVFSKALRNNGVFLDEGLLEELSNSFPGPLSGTAKTINLDNLVDYLKRKWPDRQLPPEVSTEVDSKNKKNTKKSK